MRLKPGSSVLVSLSDGTSIKGNIVRCWHWRTIRLSSAAVRTAQGEISADGYLLVPLRHVLLVQVGA